ncbi:hypothetical protein [Spartinivicinus poritis]|uniref:Uncharacterized protein n=1 Tax=Spartinivicinus poritis TaxID=2994640 RepID=A0ABT5U3U2_9GAMM|nr:hypothetical protein [Spartinivicinus sp. A2-2]MDE1461029.1 hypothetical protein [Spartinivicinus sp. A2-2]
MISVSRLSALSVLLSISLSSYAQEYMWKVNGTYQGEWSSLNAACDAQENWYLETIEKEHVRLPHLPKDKYRRKEEKITYQSSSITLGNCYFDFYSNYQWHINQSTQYYLEGDSCPFPKIFSAKAGACINKNAQPQSCEILKGNPVNIATGSKVQWFSDLSLPSITINRLYFQSGTNGTWRFNFQRKLDTIQYFEQSIVQLTRDNGQEVILYQKDGVWQDDDASGYQVKAFDDRGQYQLLTPSNATETYNNQGRLIKVESPSQQAIELAYEDKKIVISQGNLLVNYHLTDDQKITRIESGSLVRNYQYDEQGRLIGTDFNAKYKETYHYENEQYPTLLTGITNANNQRYATWQYDEKGRATVSKHAGEVDKVTFSYPDENSTTVTNPLGKKTTYRFEEINGFRKVKSVEGHASANCLAANKDYEYFDNGLLKSKTDWQGVKTTYQYNDRGLVTEKTEAAGTPQVRTITTQWHNQFSLPIQVTEPDKLTTYQYTEAGQLQSVTETGSASASTSNGMGNYGGISSQQGETSATNTDGDRVTDDEATSANNSKIDTDNDGFTNAQELVLGRNPNKKEEELTHLLADSLKDWPSEGQQGSQHWHYGYFDYAQDEDKNYQTSEFTSLSTKYWTEEKWDLANGTSPWLEVGKEIVHPSGPHSGSNQVIEHWPVKRWVSPYNGTVEVSWLIQRHSNTQGNGFTGKFYINGKLYDQKLISPTGDASSTRKLQVVINKNDILDFAVSPEGFDGSHNINYDGAKLHIIINALSANLVAKENPEKLEIEYFHSFILLRTGHQESVEFTNNCNSLSEKPEYKASRMVRNTTGWTCMVTKAQ